MNKQNWGIKDFNKYHFLHILHLHKISSEFFNRFLKGSRFLEDLTWYGKLFQILGPDTLRLLKFFDSIWVCLSLPYIYHEPLYHLFLI